MRSDWLDRDDLNHLYAALTPTNALVMRLCVETGLRIDDALAITSDQIQERDFVIKEKKTGKKRKVHLSKSLWDALRGASGAFYVFPHRDDPFRHRTRQAVFLDLKRAAKLFRIRANVSPHTLRKFYAVERLRQTGDLSKVQKELNHDRITTTLIYALADRLDELKRTGVR